MVTNFETKILHIHRLTKSQYMCSQNRDAFVRGQAHLYPQRGAGASSYFDALNKHHRVVLVLTLRARFTGVKQGTPPLLQRWVPPVVLLGALPTLSAHYLSGVLPRSLGEEEDEEEDESEGESWGDAAAAAGLSEGVWQTSVRRKRVSKMRKHKWRKRRRLERQSASRRVKN